MQAGVCSLTHLWKTEKEDIILFYYITKNIELELYLDRIINCHMGLQLIISVHPIIFNSQSSWLITDDHKDFIIHPQILSWDVCIPQTKVTLAKELLKFGLLR